MDALTYIKEKQRFCKNISCQECPLGETFTGYLDYEKNCVWAEYDHPEQAISIVEQWSKEHPQKTYLTDFISKFPKSIYHTDRVQTEICCKSLYGLGECQKGDFCDICWNTPMEGE